MLISLCQFILEGMLLTTDSGEYKLASFVDEQRMNRLYEKFILEYYAKECLQVTATASQIPWALDDGIGTMLPVMQSDIMLTKDGTVLIIDAKYYTHTTQRQYDVHTLHSGNLYQIFTYVKNKDTEFGDKPHTVSGMLLYAATDEASDTIKVFRSGFGKRKHSRTFYITTNGYVRDGVLDDRLRIAHDVLNGEIKNSRLCPLIYKLDDEKEADNKELWVKANPSLPYLPTLQLEIEQNFIDKDYDPTVASDLYTKRFNLPKGNAEIAVTDYSKVKATNRELPKLDGWTCTVGLDYAELSDWAAVNLHFRRGPQRYDINHAWLCAQSKTLQRVKAPWREWAERGLVTAVDDVSIHPDLLADYIRLAGQRYNVKMLAMDNYRWTLVSESLRKIGFDAQDKSRVKLVRPSDIMQVEPVIQECFDRELFTWGDNPCLRWAVNNTKRVRSSRSMGVDTGNFIYAKIDAKSRKTDPWMALVASMVVEPALGSGMAAEIPPVGAIKL